MTSVIQQATANVPITHCAAKTRHFDGYTVTETAADGNCLFHALSYQLLSVCGVAKSATCIRQETVEFLRTLVRFKRILLLTMIQIITWLRWKWAERGGME